MRKSLVTAMAFAILAAWAAAPAGAQLRERMKNNMVDAAAKTLVSQIQSDSCADFSSMLKSKGSGSSSSSRAKGMMKNDPAARARFVNQVAGPLVNKMIDCDLLPR